MKHFLITLAALAAMIAPAGAELIIPGTTITQAQKALAAARYTKNGLEMSVTPSDLAMDFWTVDEGILIVIYSPATGLIAALSFTIMDERPKSTRKEFSFGADSFDTATGKLVLSTKKPQ
jgi:hypothetical protein